MAKDENKEKLPALEEAGCLYYAPVYAVGYDNKELKEGVQFMHIERDNYLLFVLEGELSFSFDKYQNCPVKAGEMFYLSAMTKFEVTVITTSRIIEIMYNHVEFPCSQLGRFRLLKKLAPVEYRGRGVGIKKEIWQWLEQLVHYQESSLTCKHIMEIKNQEFYLLLKHYYTDEEKIQLYYFNIDLKSSFRETVLVYYQQVRTVQELAARLGYGIKTFRNLFKECFGQTPGKWMQEQTALRIKIKLMDPRISLKQIMFECKFESSSHFYHYCRKQFGATPTQIRDESLRNISCIIEKTEP